MQGLGCGECGNLTLCPMVCRMRDSEMLPGVGEKSSFKSRSWASAGSASNTVTVASVQAAPKPSMLWRCPDAVSSTASFQEPGVEGEGAGEGAEEVVDARRGTSVEVHGDNLRVWSSVEIEHVGGWDEASVSRVAPVAPVACLFFLPPVSR